MLKVHADRLQHFLVNEPKTMEELCECMTLALERCSELATEYHSNPESMPIQLQGELRLLDELVAAGLLMADKLMSSSLAQFCESLLEAALEAEVPGYRPQYGTVAREAGQTLH
ncbi:hypothetical protein [Burkholderia phage FLC9]|nr:hypothetical protein [Burkholderia phage FLC9]